MRKINSIIIHCSATPEGKDFTVQDIDRWHRQRGWKGIGYHYVVRKDGSIERGRPHWTIGAHAVGENSHTVGVHVCGNFEIGQPTDKQIEALAMLLGTICHDYQLPIDSDHVVGHRDLMATACPGENLYNILQTVRGKAIWYQQN